MARLYLPRVLAALVTLAIAACPARDAGAQTRPIPEQPWLGTTLDADTVRALPTANNPFTLLDAVQTEAISDRFVAGGLNVATAPRVGGLLSSWTQTQYAIGDVTITDPRHGGTPLLLPVMPFFERLSIFTGAQSVDDTAPALSMTLAPLRPATAWRAAAEGTLSGGVLTSSGGTVPPPIDRVQRWGDGNFSVAGPVNDRVGFAAAGSLRALSHAEAPRLTDASDHVGSALAHIVAAVSPVDEVRALGLIQQASTTAVTDNAVHLQGTWERRQTAGPSWRAFAGYTERKRTLSATTSTVTIDSLSSDPVSDVIDGSAGTSRRWVAGARFTPPPDRRLPTVGADLENARIRVLSSGIDTVNELLDGSPARRWIVRQPDAIDFRTSTSFAVHANEHVTEGRLTVDAGARLEWIRASADAASRGIQWTTLLPRGTLQWQLTRKADVAAIAGYRRSAYQLPLDVLAVGDPNATVADVSRWNGSTVGPLIARVGPGTAGDPALSLIDPRLERPTTDELVLAVRSRPFRGFEVELARVSKRENSVMALVDTGVPASSYRAVSVTDPSYVQSTAGPFDRPTATVLNRPAGAYGLDRYLLTNPVIDTPRSWAMELNVRAMTEHIAFFAGAALTWADGPAATIGFLPTQNDQNVLGGALVDANRTIEARGQLFQDRSHVVKMAGVYRFGGGYSVGAIARYQDGQPFSRLIVVPELNQGAIAARAYRNGGAAFTYIGTLDVRLQRTITTGRAEVTIAGDVYNLPGLDKSVSEYVVAGPRFRTPTALQPPRTALVSLRVAY